MWKLSRLETGTQTTDGEHKHKMDEMERELHYSILQKTILISLMLDSQDSKSTIHKFVKVFCAFVNLCPSVPQE